MRTPATDVTLAILLAVSGCSNGVMFCTPDATQSCVCPGAGTGTQTCNASGSAIGACVCSMNPDGGGFDAASDGANEEARPQDSSGDGSADIATDVSSDVFADAPEDSEASDGQPSDGSSSCPNVGNYDPVVLADHPAAFWDMSNSGGAEPDLTGNSNVGTYLGGTPSLVAMPNCDLAADFNGSSEYMTVPSNASMSIPTTGNLTWEAWIRPDILMFPTSNGGYVRWMGKCQSFSPTCEWEARMYDAVNAQGRCDRLSAYAFNPTAGLGSGADWQPVCGLFQAGNWYHVVAEYTTLMQPATCPNMAMYPGSINIWVNGVPWDQAAHSPTGCLSQYMVVPQANNSPLNIGSMSFDSFFEGAIGKVAIYDSLLTSTQIAAHYQAMTRLMPTGSCTTTCTFM